jgi:HSP20 family protein
MSEMNWIPTFRDVDSSLDDMDPLFEDSLARNLSEWPQPSEITRSLPVNVYLSEDRLILYADLPGLKPEDVSISIRGYSLKIEGETPSSAEEELGEVYFHERYGGKFRRSIALPTPVDVEHISATFLNGVLKVTVPRATGEIDSQAG